MDRMTAQRRIVVGVDEHCVQHASCPVVVVRGTGHEHAEHAHGPAAGR
ncbi:hypothetical protein AB0A71_30810 [Kitasatospora aureofaciens]